MEAACVGSFTGLIVLLLVNGFQLEFTLFTLMMGLLAAINGIAFTFCSFKALDVINLSLFSLFSMLGGMVLPYFYGLIFLNEEITVMKVVALLLITVAIILQNSGDKKKGSLLFYILCVCVFILNGLVSVVSKAHQIYPEFGVVSNNGFVLLKNLMRFLMFGAMLPFVSKEKGNKLSIKPKMYGVIVASAAISSMAYFLQMVCASTVPATVQFPAVSGGTIVFSALFGMIFFKEKISKKQAICLLLCVVSMIIFVL
jgi:drug/metabolite transporter (DMT)-like permease